MARIFKVRSGVTIGLPRPAGSNRPRWLAGPAEVTDEELGPKLQGYLESGAILEPLRPARPVELEVLTNDSVRAPGDRLPITRPEDFGRRAPKGGTRIQSRGKFDVDPRTLVGKSLDDLNLMIGEIDPKEGPVKNLETALKVLTQDFRSPTRASDLDVAPSGGWVKQKVPEGTAQVTVAGL